MGWVMAGASATPPPHPPDGSDPPKWGVDHVYLVPVIHPPNFSPMPTMGEFFFTALYPSPVHADFHNADVQGNVKYVDATPSRFETKGRRA